MMPGFPVPIPGIVVLIAGPILPGTFDSNLLKILHENPAVISNEGFKCAGFDEIQVGPVCCSVFGRWQWHLFNFVRKDFLIAGGLIDHHFGLTH
jgi:hypothetical protein